MTDDAGLMADLRAMWQQADPPRRGLAEEMVAAVAVAGLDEELEMLVLVRDSADEPALQVRGLGTARALSFQAAPGWSLEIEIDGGRVTGQVVDFEGDARAVEVVVETSHGASWSAGPDEVGFFVLEAALSGAIRFAIRYEDVRSTSGWVTL